MVRLIMLLTICNVDGWYIMLFVENCVMDISVSVFRSSIIFHELYGCVIDCTDALYTLLLNIHKVICHQLVYS